MLPCFDTPMVHYAVQEAADAGIEHVVFVVSQRQEAVGAYFSRFIDLELALEQRGDSAALEQALAIPQMVETSYLHQPEHLGLGHAILTTRTIIGDEPFAVLLPDDIIWSDTPTIGDMIEAYAETESSVVGVRKVLDEEASGLGIVDPADENGRLFELAGLVEKPDPGEAPSNLAVGGRYVLTPGIFGMIEQTAPGALGEIQITDAMAKLLSAEKIYGFRFPGLHFDVGTPLGLLKASVYAAMRNEQVAGGLKEWLAKFL